MSDKVLLYLKQEVQEQAEERRRNQEAVELGEDFLHWKEEYGQTRTESSVYSTHLLILYSLRGNGGAVMSRLKYMLSGLYSRWRE